MFTSTISSILLAAAVANAMPGGSWGSENGNWGNSQSWGGNNWASSTCATTSTTSIWTKDVPYATTYYKTLYNNSTSVATATATSTYYITNTKPIVKTTTSAVVTSYPVTSWKTETKEVPSTYTSYETCTETSAKPVTSLKTVVTQVPSVGSWVKTETSCVTSSTVIASTTCVPCDKDGKPSGGWGAGWGAQPTVTKAAGGW